MHTDSTMIGSAEAAQILGMNRFTLIRKANRGEIPASAKGPGKHGALLFDRGSIEALRKARAAA